MIQFEVKYYGQGKYSHSYEERWEPTPYYCPHCGKLSVWHDMSSGDYYVGENFLCTDCGTHFHLPSGAEPRIDDEQDKQRLASIREQLANQDRSKA